MDLKVAKKQRKRRKREGVLQDRIGGREGIKTEIIA